VVSKYSLFALLASANLVVSNPIVPRDTCKPEFNGFAATIYEPLFTADAVNIVNEWTPAAAVGGHVNLVQQDAQRAFVANEFVLATTGLPSNTYTIRLVSQGFPELALSGANKDLAVTVAADSFPNPDQEFSIDCTFCQSPGTFNGPKAEECIIRHPATGTCVTGSKNGETLTLQQCQGSNPQTYSFIGGGIRRSTV